jgi:transposase
MSGCGRWSSRFFLLAKDVPGMAVKRDHRQTSLEGICWRLRPETPWRDLPGEFGAWQ